MESFKINFGDLKVDQLGFVYRDIEKQASVMESIFGYSEFIFGEPHTQVINFRGKESQITSRLAFSRFGGTQIELIQWIDGDCAYKEFLDQGKEGFHHIAVYIEDIENYLKWFEKHGIGTIQTGEIFNTKWAYMDSEKKFGTVVELLEKKRKRKKKK